MRFPCVSCCFSGPWKWSSLSSLLIWLTIFPGYPDTRFAAQPCSPNAAKQLVWPGGEDPWTVSWQTLSSLEAGADAGRGASRCSFFDRKPPPHLCSVHAATTAATTTTATSTSTAIAPLLVSWLPPMAGPICRRIAQSHLWGPVLQTAHDCTSWFCKANWTVYTKVQFYVEESARVSRYALCSVR